MEIQLNKAVEESQNLQVQCSHQKREIEKKEREITKKERDINSLTEKANLEMSKVASLTTECNKLNRKLTETKVDLVSEIRALKSEKEVVTKERDDMTYRLILSYTLSNAFSELLFVQIKSLKIEYSIVLDFCIVSYFLNNILLVDS